MAGRRAHAGLSSPATSDSTTSPPSAGPGQGSPASRHSSTSDDQPRRDVGRPQAGAMAEAALRPRPYEDIYAEEAYLTTLLQKHSHLTSDLVRRFAQTEDELRDLGPSKQRRRLRKKLNLLRLQIGGLAEQHRAIFLRLSELYMETRSRDAWAQVLHQRESFRVKPGQTTTLTAVEPSSRPTRRLDASVLEFVPTGQAVAGVEATSCHEPESAAAGPDCADSEPEAANEDSEEQGCDRGLLHYRYRTAEAEQEQRCHSPWPERRARGHNRLSLPNLEMIWPN